MPVTATELVGSALQNLWRAAGSSRKHSKLAQECKALLDNLDEVLATPQGAVPAYAAQVFSPHLTAENGAPGSPSVSTPNSAAASHAASRADASAVASSPQGGRMEAREGVSTKAGTKSEAGVVQASEGGFAIDEGSSKTALQVAGEGDTPVQGPNTSDFSGMVKPFREDCNMNQVDLDTATISDAGTTPTAERAAALHSVGEFQQLQLLNASPSRQGSVSLPVLNNMLSAGALLPIMRVMRLGIDTGRPQAVDICLDLMHKLIAHRFMQGAAYAVNVDLNRMDETGEETKPSTAHIDPASLAPQAQAVELICRCEEIADEGIELQVLRGLLTATCSTTFTVHGQALLLAMRTCYNIFLMSHSEKNQNTAKASLTQMLETVFQRMEANSVMVQVRPIVVADVLGLPKNSPQDPVANVVQGFLNTVVMTAAYASGTQLTEDIRSSVAASFNANLPSEQIVPQEPEVDSDDERHHFRLAAGNVAAVGGSEVASDSPRTVAKKKEDAKVNMLQKDAFLVFRSLCKLSIRTSDTATMLDAAAVRGKVLALELLKILLENSGTSFRSNDKFISAIRQYLCLSLLKNSASSLSQVLSLSCSIFLTLMSKFRQALKAEVSVFFPMILLKTMEPQNTTGAASTVPGGAPPVSATFTYRSVVLRCLREMCQDGQLLVDLFVNYDCDLEGSNLFERMVNGLVKIAQSPLQSADAYGGSQNLQNEQFLRQEALHSLVSILESMEKWYKQSLANEEPPPEDKEEQLVATLPETGNQTIGDEGGEDLSTKRANKLKFQEGIELFNKKPKKGIKLLQSLGMLGSSPKEVATFLVKTEGLNKTMIGDFMGEREDLPLKVMHAYVDELDFSNLEFDDAIRKFLSGFRLPGEAQKIDRLMEKFAERYLKCNPNSFKSADVAYVLAYSVIMLNTDAHNPQVKKKMSLEDFLKNNRGINDGADLSEEFMHNLYQRIVTNEIKMKDSLLDVAPNQSQLAAKGFMTTLLSLMVAHRAGLSNEPSDDAVARTLDTLHQKAKGATFFIATEGETVKPMLDVIWAPMLGALSVLFEEYSEARLVRLCLSGFAAAVCLTGVLDMTNLKDVFLNSLCSFTHLHSPSTMKYKNALAFKALLQAAEAIGDHLGERWVDVLRCMSRWELLQQIASGMPTDAALFTMQTVQKPGPKSSTEAIQKQLQRMSSTSAPDEPRSWDNLAMNESSIMRVPFSDRPGLGVGLGGKKAELDQAAIPEEVINSVDTADLNHVFFRSASLDSEAIVHFVRALCAISLDELRVASAPRVFSLTKIVEIAHFNMTRIRLVWSRIWNVLSEYFIQVGCHSNLSVAMYAVDSLRQLAMKFLERDELANYTFQNDFLRPFVVVMRQSQALEIRELIIRCLSQMVLARVTNVKSGWKSMFMVFTTAANDKEPTIVRLAFDTIEKIVREHFIHITETETTTFTDCVNCLIAFTNNPHSLDVALNSIAFLRFCAMKLAEGAIGNMDQLSDEARASISQLSTQPTRLVAIDTRSNTAGPATPTTPKAAIAGFESTPPPSSSKLVLRFTDKEEHVYFWFPLLAGLSELTFDPREQIRNGAMEVLFDTLKYHGNTYTQSFWVRIFDSVLLPIFDHVRAEVTDTTTFTSEHRRAQEDAWLYETCTRCLQHLIDIFSTFYGLLHPLLERMLDLLGSFICRTHQSLASVGVAAFVRLAKLAGEQLSDEYWQQVMESLVNMVEATLPSVTELLASLPAAPPPPLSEGSSPKATPRQKACSLREGVGARKLSKFRCNAAVQLLLVQACSEVYASQHRYMPSSAVCLLLDALQLSSSNACRMDMDLDQRTRLGLQQMSDQVPDDRSVTDPPLLRLETESSLAYLSVLLHLTTQEALQLAEACEAEDRLTELCLAVLERYSLRALSRRSGAEEVFRMPTGEVALLLHSSQGMPPSIAPPAQEFAPFSPLVVATLRAISCFSEPHFRKQLPRTFPLLTRLVRCEYAPSDVQQALGDLLMQRVASFLQ